jgi:type IV secretory pathway TraG/TraD family ATPase VirD4
VLRINLVDPSNGDAYDPLSAIRRDANEIGNDTQNFVELLMPSEPWNKYRHFGDLAQEFLRGLIVHKLTTEKNVSLYSIVNLILTQKEKFEATMKVMQHSSNDVVRGGAYVYQRVKGEEKGGFDSTLLRKLKFWLDANMKAVTTLGPNDDHWSFDDVLDSKKPMVIYIRTGLNRGEFTGHLVRLMMGNAVNAVKWRWDRESKPLKEGLWVITDESRNIGRCEPTNYARLASIFGCRFTSCSTSRNFTPTGRAS